MFQKDFVWGTAASAYQVEGAASADGKGPSIWDEFSHIPGKIFEDHTADVSCDQYHRFREDVALLAEMGIKAYRFSIAWTRILPNGCGQVEERGIRYYRELAEELHRHGIRANATLFHWDYPAALMRRGGWLNPESPQWFAEYAKVVAQRLGDVVDEFSTFNEPEMMFGNAFVETNLAPGYKAAEGDVIRMIHNMLIAHGLAVQQLREIVPGKPIGITLCSDPAIPENSDEESIASASAFYFKAGEDILSLSFGLSWYADPVMLGTYPEDGLARFGKYLPATWQEDMQTICQPLDYQGHNVYTGAPVRMDADGVSVPRQNKTGYAHNALGWTIEPESLYWGPRFLYERYHLPVVITENGMSCHDVVSLDGKVHDPNRIDYTHRYLLQLRRAVDDGIPVLGYYHWSFLDNFEWAKGYNERFGLVYIDYETQERIRKDSSFWYQRVIETNGDEL